MDAESSSKAHSDKQVATSVMVLPLEDGETSDLGHVPRQRFNISKFAKSFGSRQAWLGDYVS